MCCKNCRSCAEDPFLTLVGGVLVAAHAAKAIREGDYHRCLVEIVLEPIAELMAQLTDDWDALLAE